MNRERRTKALHILNSFDSTGQKLKCCEELAELEAELMKHINKGGNTDAILEEMADVYITMEQLLFMMPFGENDLEKMIDYKLDRTLERIRSK